MAIFCCITELLEIAFISPHIEAGDFCHVMLKPSPYDQYQGYFYEDEYQLAE